MKNNLKYGIKIAKKLDFEKPLTISEYRILKKSGYITGEPNNLQKTEKGKELIRKVKAVGFY